MKIEIYKEDTELVWVDRDSRLNSYGRQGFEISIGGVEFHFEDEADIEQIARRVLERLGVKVVG